MNGSVEDMALVVILLITLVVSIFIATKVLTEFNDVWSNQTGVGNTSKEVLQKGIDTMHMFDAMFIIFAFGVFTAVIIGALNVQSHPAFFIFGLIMNLIIVLISMTITNFFGKFAGATGMSSIANSFPWIVTFMKNLPLVVFVFSLVIAVVMYTKPTQGNGIA